MFKSDINKAARLRAILVFIILSVSVGFLMFCSCSIYSNSETETTEDLPAEQEQISNAALYEAAIEITNDSESKITSEEITEPPNNPVTTVAELSIKPTETTQAALVSAVLNGYYTQSYNNGDTYTGSFVNGIRSGNGTYTWANGIIYTGEWLNGEPSGKGSYVYPAAEPYGISKITMRFATPTDFSEIKPGVTVIGCSVSLGAKNTLLNTIPECYVDAKVSRPVKDGAAVFQDLQNKGELREYIVIALGTNGNYDDKKWLTKIIDDLNPGHKLIFVTPFDGRSNENSKITKETADWLRELPSQYDFITVADWAASVSSHTDILAYDKVHMGGQDSINLYVDLIVKALDKASQNPAK